MKIRIKVQTKRSKKHSLHRKRKNVEVNIGELRQYKKFHKKLYSRGGDCTEKNEDENVEFPPE